MKHLTLLPSLLLLALLTACAGNNSPASTNTPSATPASGTPATAPASGEKVSFSVANAIVQSRCALCHTGASARAGVNLSSPDQVKKYADRIKARTVDSKGMPQGNATNMTDAERQTLGQWISQGASLE